MWYVMVFGVYASYSAAILGACWITQSGWPLFAYLLVPGFRRSFDN